MSLAPESLLPEAEPPPAVSSPAISSPGGSRDSASAVADALQRAAAAEVQAAAEADSAGGDTTGSPQPEEPMSEQPSEQQPQREQQPQSPHKILSAKRKAEGLAAPLHDGWAQLASKVPKISTSATAAEAVAVAAAAAARPRLPPVRIGSGKGGSSASGSSGSDGAARKPGLHFRDSLNREKHRYRSVTIAAIGAQKDRLEAAAAVPLRRTGSNDSRDVALPRLQDDDSLFGKGSYEVLARVWYINRIINSTDGALPRLQDDAILFDWVCRRVVIGTKAATVRQQVFVVAGLAPRLQEEDALRLHPRAEGSAVAAERRDMVRHLLAPI